MADRYDFFMKIQIRMGGTFVRWLPSASFNIRGVIASFCNLAMQVQTCKICRLTSLNLIWQVRTCQICRLTSFNLTLQVQTRQICRLSNDDWKPIPIVKFKNLKKSEKDRVLTPLRFAWTCPTEFCTAQPKNYQT